MTGAIARSSRAAMKASASKALSSIRRGIGRWLALRVFLSAGAMLVSAHDGGVNHHVFVVVIAGQELENPLESTALGPSVEALIDNLPVTKALGQIAPRDAGAKPEENGFDEQTIVRRRTAHMAFPPWQNVFHPIPLLVAQAISPHRSAPPQADLSRVRHLLIRESLAYPKHKRFRLRFRSVLPSTEHRP